MIKSTEDGTTFDYHFYLKHKSYKNLTQLESEIDIIKLLNSSKKVDNNTFFTDIDDVKYTIKTSKDDKIKGIAINKSHHN